MRRPIRPVRRRLLAVVALGGVAAALLGGCGRPAGVDGDLADDWVPVSAPASFTPPAGVCHAAGYSNVGYLSSFESVDCSSKHRTETVHVGTFTGPAAGRAAPPPKGSHDLRAAYRECDAEAKDYVGADRRTGRLWLGVVLPSPQAWAGGAKWFRCDMTEMTTVEDNGRTAERAASLRNALRATSPLSLTCYAVKLNKRGAIDTMPRADCRRAHNAEFAGVWNAPDLAYPKKDADWDRFHTECRKVIARYVDVPADDKIKFRTGVVSLPDGEDQWEIGNRGVRCYLWLSGRKLTKSLKGAGTAALPIQFE